MLLLPSDHHIGDIARFRLRDEAASWAEEVVEAARATHHRRLTVLLTWAASSAWSLGRLEEAKRFGEEAVNLVEFQRAYDANSHFITVLDQITSDIIMMAPVTAA